MEHTVPFTAPLLNTFSVFPYFPFTKRTHCRKTKKINFGSKNPLLKGRNTMAEEAGHPIRFAKF